MKKMIGVWIACALMASCKTGNSASAVKESAPADACSTNRGNVVDEGMCMFNSEYGAIFIDVASLTAYKAGNTTKALASFVNGDHVPSNPENVARDVMLCGRNSVRCPFGADIISVEGGASSGEDDNGFAYQLCKFSADGSRIDPLTWCMGPKSSLNKELTKALENLRR